MTCILVYVFLLINLRIYGEFFFPPFPHICNLFSCASASNAMGFTIQSSIGKNLRWREPWKSEEAHQIKQTVGSLFKIMLPP